MRSRGHRLRHPLPPRSRGGEPGYNALTRRITLTDVRLAAEGFHDRPFLIASRIEVKLPWSVYRRRFAIDHLAIDKGIVDIVRDENNVVNLPPASTAPTPERARQLDIRSLTLNGLDVQYEDQVRDWGVKVPRIESELLNTALGAKGDFAVRGTLTFRLRDRTMTMAPFETVMTFDGSNVALEQAQLSSTEIEAFLSGDIKRVLDSPSLDLALKGSVNLDKAIKWVPPPPVPVDRHRDDRRNDRRAGAQFRRPTSSCTATRSTSGASAISPSPGR